MQKDIIEGLNKCKRSFIKNIYQDEKSKSYWKETFKKLEEESEIAQHKNIEQLKLVFKNRILQQLVDILNNPTSSEIRHDSKENKVPKLTKCITILLEKIETVDFRQKLIKEIDNKKKNHNMYVNFLQTQPELAQIWRPKPPRTFTGMNLFEKCEAITLAIATDFMNWLKELGGDDLTKLDAHTVLSLFEISYSSHSADSLCVYIKELCSISGNIAAVRGEPKRSYKEAMYRQIKRDIKSIKPREAMFAFGTMLPIDIRPPPMAEQQVISKWMSNKRVPTRVADMSVVFEGIEDLQVTQGYVKWLQQNSNLNLPAPLKRYMQSVKH